MRWRLEYVVDWVRLRLDVDRFADSKFILPLRHAAALGIDFTTMADVGDTAQNRRALYALNKTCSSDWMTASGPRADFCSRQSRPHKSLKFLRRILVTDAFDDNGSREIFRMAGLGARVSEQHRDRIHLGRFRRARP
jgi:hypothetical protein